MQELGFEKYAIDYVDCPEGLLWYLQSEVGLHRTVGGILTAFMTKNPNSEPLFLPGHWIGW